MAKDDDPKKKERKKNERQSKEEKKKGVLDTIKEYGNKLDEIAAKNREKIGGTLEDIKSATKLNTYIDYNEVADYLTKKTGVKIIPSDLVAVQNAVTSIALTALVSQNEGRIREIPMYGPVGDAVGLGIEALKELYSEYKYMPVTPIYPSNQKVSLPKSTDRKLTSQSQSQSQYQGSEVEGAKRLSFEQQLRESWQKDLDYLFQDSKSVPKEKQKPKPKGQTSTTTETLPLTQAKFTPTTPTPQQVTTANPNAPAINPAFANSALQIASVGNPNKPTTYQPPVMPSGQASSSANMGMTQGVYGSKPPTTQAQSSNMGITNGAYGSQQPTSPAKTVALQPVAQQTIGANIWAKTAAQKGQPEVAAFWNKVAQNLKTNNPKGNV